MAKVAYTVVARGGGTRSFVAAGKGGLRLVGCQGPDTETLDFTTAKAWAHWARTFCGCRTKIVSVTR